MLESPWAVTVTLACEAVVLVYAIEATYLDDWVFRPESVGKLPLEATTSAKEVRADEAASTTSETFARVV